MLFKIPPAAASLRSYIENFNRDENLKIFSHVNRVVRKALEENREADKEAHVRYVNLKKQQAQTSGV